MDLYTLVYLSGVHTHFYLCVLPVLVCLAVPSLTFAARLWALPAIYSTCHPLPNHSNSLSLVAWIIPLGVCICNPESMLPHYMIWLSSHTIFWCDFHCDGYYIIQRLFCQIIWYGHHLQYIEFVSLLHMEISGEYVIKQCNKVIHECIFNSFLQNVLFEKLICLSS